MQSDHLKPNHFYNKENGCIYWAIQELYKKGIDKIDAFNIESMINTNQAVKRMTEKFNVKDMQEFIELSSTISRSSSSEYNMLVNKVMEFAFKRELHGLLSKLSGECYNDEIDLEQLNNKVYKSIGDITEKFWQQTRLKSLVIRLENCGMRCSKDVQTMVCSDCRQNFLLSIIISPMRQRNWFC